MAEYLVVKPHNLVPLDKLDPVDAAPLADAALTPMHAINRVRDRLTGDSTVVLIGLGGLGHVGYSLDDAVQAFDDLHHGKIQGRAVLVP